MAVQAVETPSESLQDLYGKFYSGDTTIDDLAAELLRQEQCVARSILAMHVIGYSTTWHDVLSDLLPWVETDASRDTTRISRRSRSSTTPAQTGAGACPNAMRGRAAS